MFKKVANYLHNAIKSNTGISSLSLIVVIMGVMSIIILLVVCICMMIEILFNHTIASTIDYSAIIASVAALLTAVGLPKAINNYGENKYRKHPMND